MNKPIVSYAAWTEVRLVKAPEAERRSEVKLGTAMLIVAILFFGMAKMLRGVAIKCKSASDETFFTAIAIILCLFSIIATGVSVYNMIP